MADQGLSANPVITAMDTPAKPAAKAVELDAGDLVGHGSAYCPNPKMALWSEHPRVYIELGKTGQGQCPYCGTVYRLKPGSAAHGH